MNNDQQWMALALKQAEQASACGEVPVGAVIVKNNQLIAQAFNTPIASHDCTQHAEINAIRRAGQVLKNYRLIGCSLYVTLEPCLMCAAAMVHARIDRCVFAATDPKSGVLGGCFDIQELAFLNHHYQVDQGPHAATASALLKDFFKAKRQSR